MRCRRISLALAAAALHAQSYNAWKDYGGTSDSMQYSSLKQIDKSNVARLEQAWFFPVEQTSNRFGFNPVIVDGAMYVLGKDRAILALEHGTVTYDGHEGTNPRLLR